MAPSIAHEYETEISHGKLLISVVARDEKERDEFMEVMNHWGASDIHHSGEAVA